LEENRTIILAETPWINDTQSEADKKTKLALLFALEKKVYKKLLCKKKKQKH
jgi:hypothetical protein